MTSSINAEKEAACRLLGRKGIDSLAGAISTGSGQTLPFDGSTVRLEVGYGDLPGLEDIWVLGHLGTLRVLETPGGNWAVWTGRRHFYQGYSHEEIGFYIDVSSAMGATELVCVNAAGGLDSSLNVGDLIVIDRYKCFIPIPGPTSSFDGGPWRETSGKLLAGLLDAADRSAIAVSTGSYVGVPGPTYETEAEVRWLRGLGCLVVGMSTVPELVRAAELGMDAIALSMIANVHGPDTALTHEEVVRSGERGVTTIGRLIWEFLGLK